MALRLVAFIILGLAGVQLAMPQAFAAYSLYREDIRSIGDPPPGMLDIVMDDPEGTPAGTNAPNYEPGTASTTMNGPPAPPKAPEPAQ